MSYNQIKWLILLIPTLTIGLWEYARHSVLESYISMNLGNWIAPLLVFLVTVTFLLKLFDMLEDMQEQLKAERGQKASLEERERLARELHDGISQSLFLMSVKMDQLERNHPTVAEQDSYGPMRRTIRKVYEDVRQSIANLKVPATPEEPPWRQAMQQLASDFGDETGIAVQLSWDLPEDRLTAKDKVELLACLREALVNVQKHARASRVRMDSREVGRGWSCSVADDGQGFAPAAAATLEPGATPGVAGAAGATAVAAASAVVGTAVRTPGSTAAGRQPVDQPPSGEPGARAVLSLPETGTGKYGLRIMQERCASMGWLCFVHREQGWTKVEIVKEATDHD
ncbi:sensor histidine kinase [Paenibacillus swuensis]|uniref:sensor histidine kinase n=1 Tax=Paenibacillus swuensis TaxID=1178515 RepID=UPI000B1D51F3|nr:histidine kinase [Paenibacillus swuensis]